SRARRRIIIGGAEGSQLEREQKGRLAGRKWPRQNEPSIAGKERDSNQMPRTTGTAKSKPAKSYKHPESESPMRPEVGTQAQFKKKLPKKQYRYDDSLSPALDWDGQNPAREQGE